MDPFPLSLSVTPHGHLVLAHDAAAPLLDAGLSQRLLKSFERGSGNGLLLLGAGQAGTALPPTFSFWREFASRYVTALCATQESEAKIDSVRVLPPPGDELA